MFVLYTLSYCPYCHQALELLNERGLPYKYYDVTNEDKERIKDAHQMNTFPQIFYVTNKNKYYRIGGYTELKNLVNSL